ncbi:MAG: hypothetical protein EOS20_17315 [Mesorhizobium sp.]|uniref:hypothetical protein n=1 Tax=Mesorhizobium sp. TaxID=1871066 RepID=UPI000FE46590|nr:hypothetical protein [Mesorhizobium sp.]RWQ35833.1 MAG: hypothetical protein EOS20_17315 [Mesorhizobium sp.]
MNFTDDQVEGFILSFMGSRCAVSSQHKLPGLAEILGTVIVEFIGVERAKTLIEKMIKDGRIIEYGPYLSDHEIDVL